MKTGAAPKELVIFLARELPEREMVRIEEEAKEYKIRFKIDPCLIGGAALACNGQYKDYSLAARFSQKAGDLQKIYL